MSSPDSTVTCSLTIEWTNNQGIKTRNQTHKQCVLRLIRNDARQIFLEVNAVKQQTYKFMLKSINVHKKFMNEGKATIVFQEEKCSLFLSNAPPGQLLEFLRTMFFKMTGEKAEKNPNTSLRTQVLSTKSSNYDEISPVTIADINNAKKQLPRTTDTTPSPGSRKRKLSEKNERGHVSKKLYSESPVLKQPLNIEQQQILDACISGHNVFFTGSAGTGKSYLLKKIIAALPPDVTVATASTGVAACHIGGITLHSFAGIGAGEANLDRCCKMASKPAVAQIWRRCRHLIIDEISMVDGRYFEKIEAVARHIRGNEKPFGGIQLILCGDFFQLPPVIKQQPNPNEKEMKFCFQAPAWDKCVNVSYELKQVHRQTDAKFIDILNNIRVGRVTPEIVAKLSSTSKQKIEQDGILATRLCSQNADADIINNSKLNSLPGESKTFLAQDSDQAYTRQLDMQTTVANKLELKIGAQVMLLKNISISGGLVNGARGIVVGFKNDLPVVKFRNNKEYIAKHEKWIIKTLGGVLISRSQVPLKLAWAFSIHKSQGLTLDCVEMSLSRVFEAGQAYVALSRAQSLETLRVLDFNMKQVWANPEVIKFYRILRQKIERMEMVPLGNVKSNLMTKIGEKKVPSKSKSAAGASKLLKSKPLVTIS